MENMKKKKKKSRKILLLKFFLYIHKLLLRKTLDSKSVKEYTLTKERNEASFVKILQIFISLYILSQMRIVEITFQDFSYLRESLAS